MQLRNFQVTALKKAMTFENVEIIVYSTCSIHVEENESVVNELLYGSDEGSQWTVEPPARFSSWERRGLPFGRLSAGEASALIRCAPSDGMNGFFVALFVKKSISKSEGGGSGTAGNNTNNNSSISSSGSDVRSASNSSKSANSNSINIHLDKEENKSFNGNKRKRDDLDLNTSQQDGNTKKSNKLDKLRV